VTPRRLFPALLAALALAVALTSCGSGGTSTIQKKTYFKAKKEEGTYLPEVATGHPLVRPPTYRFSVDGDLVAKDLRWGVWGPSLATASGTLVERPASGLVDTFSGRVVASQPRRCRGATYYTEVFAHLPPQADFVPTEPTKLSTPCD
jgi:hypothetical protein